MYKLISIDLDGTLLNDEKKIEPETLESLKEYSVKKGVVVLNSGRSLMEMNNLLKGNDLNCYMISQNGSFIMDKNKEIIYKSFISNDDLNEIFSVLDQEYLTYQVHTEDTIYLKKAKNFEKKLSSLAKLTCPKGKTLDQEASIYRDIILKNTKIVDQTFLREVKDIIKIVIIDYDLRRLEKLKTKLNSFEDYQIMKSFICCLEIIGKNTDKFEALKILLKKYSLDISDVLAIGNDLNDYKMIKNSGLGIAMGNGVILF